MQVSPHRNMTLLGFTYPRVRRPLFPFCVCQGKTHQNDAACGWRLDEASSGLSLSTGGRAVKCGL
jgi:hypothetical protein